MFILMILLSSSTLIDPSSQIVMVIMGKALWRSMQNRPANAFDIKKISAYVGMNCRNQRDFPNS